MAIGRKSDRHKSPKNKPIVGEGSEKQFSLDKEALAEYEREPALV